MLLFINCLLIAYGKSKAPSPSYDPFAEKSGGSSMSSGGSSMSSSSMMGGGDSSSAMIMMIGNQALGLKGQSMSMSYGLQHAQLQAQVGLQQSVMGLAQQSMMMKSQMRMKQQKREMMMMQMGMTEAPKKQDSPGDMGTEVATVVTADPDPFDAYFGAVNDSGQSFNQVHDEVSQLADSIAAGKSNSEHNLRKQMTLMNTMRKSNELTYSSGEYEAVANTTNLNANPYEVSVI